LRDKIEKKINQENDKNIAFKRIRKKWIKKTKAIKLKRMKLQKKKYIYIKPTNREITSRGTK
jgi:hypothetical protein